MMASGSEPSHSLATSLAICSVLVAKGVVSSPLSFSRLTKSDSAATAVAAAAAMQQQQQQQRQPPQKKERLERAQRTNLILSLLRDSNDRILATESIVSTSDASPTVSPVFESIKLRMAQSMLQGASRRTLRTLLSELQHVLRYKGARGDAAATHHAPLMISILLDRDAGADTMPPLTPTHHSLDCYLAYIALSDDKLAALEPHCASSLLRLRDVVSRSTRQVPARAAVASAALVRSRASGSGSGSGSGVAAAAAAAEAPHGMRNLATAPPPSRPQPCAIVRELDAVRRQLLNVTQRDVILLSLSLAMRSILNECG